MTGMESQPAYVAVANDIRGRIESGELAPGKPIKSASQLMDEYHVSSTVIKNAMRELRASGHTEGQQGKAVYARIPTGPQWLANLIDAGSGLAALAEECIPDLGDEPVKRWQEALDNVPVSQRRRPEQ